MAVGLKLGSITDEIGTSEFFNAFFSTIAVNLEPQGWGSRFPVLMRALYAGALGADEAADALDELEIVKDELSRIPVDKIVWDAEDRSKSPPWGANIASEITDLGNYFVTSTGRDLISTLRDIFQDLRESGGAIEVVKY